MYQRYQHVQKGNSIRKCSSFIVPFFFLAQFSRLQLFHRCTQERNAQWFGRKVYTRKLTLKHKKGFLQLTTYSFFFVSLSSELSHTLLSKKLTSNECAHPPSKKNTNTLRPIFKEIRQKARPHLIFRLTVFL